MTDTPPAADPTTVNPQIVDAVKTSTEYAFGFAPLATQPPDPLNRISAGAAISYDKAAQAAALAMQDAADYQRNVMSVSAIVQGKAMAKILASPGAPSEGALVAYVLALVSAIAAPISAAVASEAAILPLKNFPKA